jgi:hypothetical protein
MRREPVGKTCVCGCIDWHHRYYRDWACRECEDCDIFREKDETVIRLTAELEAANKKLEMAKEALEKVDGECPYGDCSCKLLHTIAREALAAIQADGGK